MKSKNDILERDKLNIENKDQELETIKEELSQLRQKYENENKKDVEMKYEELPQTEYEISQLNWTAVSPGFLNSFLVITGSRDVILQGKGNIKLGMFLVGGGGGGH